MAKMASGKFIMVRIPDNSDISERLKEASHRMRMPYHELLDKWLSEMGLPGKQVNTHANQGQLPFFENEEKKPETFDDVKHGSQNYALHDKQNELEKRVENLTALVEKLLESQTSQPGPAEPVEPSKPIPAEAPESEKTTAPDPLDAAHVYNEASRVATIAYIKNLSEIEKWSTRKIAEHLNEKGYSTFSGKGSWKHGTVYKIISSGK